jgi:hypothetical protein
MGFSMYRPIKGSVLLSSKQSWPKGFSPFRCSQESGQLDEIESGRHPEIEIGHRQVPE